MPGTVLSAVRRDPVEQPFPQAMSESPRCRAFAHRRRVVDLDRGL